MLFEATFVYKELHCISWKTIRTFSFHKQKHAFQISEAKKICGTNIHLADKSCYMEGEVYKIHYFYPLLTTLKEMLGIPRTQIIFCNFL